MAQEKKELRDYVENYMSFESAENYLDTRGLKLSDFKAIMISQNGRSPEFGKKDMNRNVSENLEHLASNAIIKKCTYVVSIRELVLPEQVLFLGTGLIPRE